MVNEAIVYMLAIPIEIVPWLTYRILTPALE